MAVDELPRGRQAEGPATILAIGTANPSNVVDQSTYPDYYFRVTKSEHMTELKQKFKRMCDKSMIKKRHMHLTEDLLKEQPNLCTYMAPSLNIRQDIGVLHAPQLGKEAAEKAIEEWGQPKSKITHLIFCTSSSAAMLGADYHLSRLLNLRPCVKRYMMYQQGCSGGGTALRLAKDLAENNFGARVLVVCSELTTILFHSPDDADLDSLIAQSLFGDGAAAVIVGSDPITGVEKPIFQILSSAQTIVPDSHWVVGGQLREHGMSLVLSRELPDLVSENIEERLKEAFDPLDVSDWNSIFWVMHPGGRGILDKAEAKLGLKPEKFRCSRHVLSEYGNMASASIFFVMDEMRKSSLEQGLSSTGGGHEWGVVLAFGPGITVETLVLRSVPIIT